MSFIHTNLRSLFTRLVGRVWRLNFKAIMLSLSLCIGCVYTTTSLADDELLTRAQAVEIAKQRSGDNARVLGVKEIKDKNGELTYAVKVIKNGRVKVHRIAAKP